jgi:ABC-type sugar transport system ATPase subunit
MNFLPVTVSEEEGGRVSVALPGGALLSLDAQGKSIKPGRMTLGIRPEHISAKGDGQAVLHAPVRFAEYLGSETLFFLTLPDRTELAVKADGLASAKPGDILTVGLPAAACHLFDEGGLAVLNGDLTR